MQVYVVHVLAVIDPSLAHVELPASLVSPPTSDAPIPPSATHSTSMRKEAKKKYHLSSSDTLFAELRDVNFSTVLKRLNKIARRLEEEYKVFIFLLHHKPVLTSDEGQQASQNYTPIEGCRR